MFAVKIKTKWLIFSINPTTDTLMVFRQWLLRLPWEDSNIKKAYNIGKYIMRIKNLY